MIAGAGRSLPAAGTAPPGTWVGPGRLDRPRLRGPRRRPLPGALCALGIEVAEDHQGRGLSKVLLDAMADTARRAGLGTVLVPVRPTWKERYPLVPIERYAAWTRDDGTPFDPWIRTQVGAGGTIAAASAHSSRITGTVAEWEHWTGLALPEDGEYVFPGGLAPLQVDRARDRGAYWEPGVWITHEA
ncbi:N-acetyltransferase [Streptomyces diastatochromogenes]|nr:N-acetyltransferase [Streptomyces diastatochromogenes]